MNVLKNKTSIAASVITLLVAAPAAMASGGANSGGVNAGGANGGGVTPPGGNGASAKPCVKIVSVNEQVGYYSVWAAIWHHYTIKSCSSAGQTVTVSVTDTNRSTGAVEFSEYRYHQLTASENVGSVFDNDSAPFSTDYNVTTTASDENGNVLATLTAPATTPPQP